MKVENWRDRKAVSPILATIILIAITLIAGVIVSGFVFGLFGTFINGPTLQISGETCFQGAIGTGFCTFTLTNTGGTSGSVVGCVLYGTLGVSASGTTYPAGQSTVVVSAGTTSSAPVHMACGGVALTAGVVVSGSLIVASGAPLAFSVFAS